MAAAKGERVGKYFLKPDVWEVPVKTFGEWFQRDKPLVSSPF